MNEHTYLVQIEVNSRIIVKLLNIRSLFRLNCSFKYLKTYKKLLLNIMLIDRA